MKAIWKGSISFGLVSIPVMLFTATQDNDVSFRMLHSSCKTPVKYKKWCEQLAKKVNGRALETHQTTPSNKESARSFQRDTERGITVMPY